MKKYIKIGLLMIIMILMVLFLSDDPFEPKDLTKVDNKSSSSKKIEKPLDVITNMKVVQSSYPLNHSNMEGISEEMQSSQYWTSKLNDGNNIILTENEIQSFNSDIYKNVSSVVDLSQYGDTLQGTVLTSYIKQFTMPAVIYGDNNAIISSETRENIIENLNLQNIKTSNNVKFGLTVRKSSVRSFPTDISVYKTNKNDKLDRFQLTGCNACEMVAVLYESKDSLWYFVQTSNYRGWVKKQDIALMQSKEEAVDYVNNKNFIVINSNYISINFKLENSQDFSASYFMGAKIPIVKETDTGYVVEIPVNDSMGKVEYKNILLNKTLDISKGYLQYTRNNIINQAFKLNGADYDWGDKNNGRDCSSFILSVYRSFGFNLPRDTDEQEKIPGKVYSFNQGTLSELKPGAAIYMPGHVVMYLGKDNGKYYVIQSFLGYKPNSGDSYVSCYKIAVTKADILNASGVPYTDKYTKAIQMEK